MVNDMLINKYSFQKIASKLSSFVLSGQSVRVVACYSYSDSESECVSRSLYQQFGVVPEEVYFSRSGFDFNDLKEFENFYGLTIFIVSVPVTDYFTKRLLSGKAASDAYVPEAYRDLLKQQTRILGRFVRQNKKMFQGGYVCVSGLSVSHLSSDESILSSAEFLPWYLEKHERNHLGYSIAQPELGSYIQELAEIEPDGVRLDAFLGDMQNRS